MERHGLVCCYCAQPRSWKHAPSEWRRLWTYSQDEQHVADFDGRVRGLRTRHSVAGSSEDRYSKPTRLIIQGLNVLCSIQELVRTGFAGGNKDGRILEISGGLNVIKPMLSGQVQAPHKLGVAGGHAALEPGTIPQRTPTGKNKVSPPRGSRLVTSVGECADNPREQ